MATHPDLFKARRTITSSTRRAKLEGRTIVIEHQIAEIPGAFLDEDSLEWFSVEIEGQPIRLPGGLGGGSTWEVIGHGPTEAAALDVARYVLAKKKSGI